MRKVAFAVVLVFVAGVAVAPASGSELHANVVSWAPADVEPGKPVAVVLGLYGQPVADVDLVEVVIRSEGQSRRFPAVDIGGGRFSTSITFPRAGSWDLTVSYGEGDEILLGKGAIRIDDAPAAGGGGGGGGTGPLSLAVGGFLLAGLAWALRRRFRDKLLHAHERSPRATSGGLTPEPGQ